MTLTLILALLVKIYKKNIKVYGFDKFKENVTKLINKAKKKALWFVLLMKRIFVENLIGSFWEEPWQAKTWYWNTSQLCSLKYVNTIKTGFDAFFNMIYMVYKVENRSPHLWVTYWRMFLIVYLRVII